MATKRVPKEVAKRRAARAAINRRVTTVHITEGQRTRLYRLMLIIASGDEVRRGDLTKREADSIRKALLRS